MVQDSLKLFVYPSFAGANTGGGSLASGSSNVFLVQANNVTIQNLTVDGDNPAIGTSPSIEARNGIITNHAVVFTIIWM